MHANKKEKQERKL